MAVSVLSAQRPIQERPQPKEREYDFVDNIMRGLNIASSIYGIKHNITQNEVLGLQKTKLESDISADVETRKSAAEQLAQMKDPQSIASQTYRQEYQKLFGQLQKPDASAYELQQFLDPKKLKEIEAGATFRSEGQKAVENVKAENDRKKQLLAFENDLKKTEIKHKNDLELLNKRVATEKNLPQNVYQAAGFATRMLNATTSLSNLEKGGFDPTALKNKAQGASWYPNRFKESDMQRMEQLKRDFINATLRKESGAAISPKEFSEANAQYFAQDGDSIETLMQKEQNRNAKIAEMLAEGKKAMPAVTQEFQKLQKSSQQPTPSQAPTVDMGAIEAELIKRKGIAGIKR